MQPRTWGSNAPPLPTENCGSLIEEGSGRVHSKNYGAAFSTSKGGGIPLGEESTAADLLAIQALFLAIAKHWQIEVGDAEP